MNFEFGWLYVGLDFLIKKLKILKITYFLNSNVDINFLKIIVSFQVD